MNDRASIHTPWSRIEQGYKTTVARYEYEQAHHRWEQYRWFSIASTAISIVAWLGWDRRRLRERVWRRRHPWRAFLFWALRVLWYVYTVYAFFKEPKFTDPDVLQPPPPGVEPAETDPTLRHRPKQT